MKRTIKAAAVAALLIIAALFLLAGCSEGGGTKPIAGPGEASKAEEPVEAMEDSAAPADEAGAVKVASDEGESEAGDWPVLPNEDGKPLKRNPFDDMLKADRATVRKRVGDPVIIDHQAGLEVWYYKHKVLAPTAEMTNPEVRFDDSGKVVSVVYWPPELMDRKIEIAEEKQADKADGV